MKFLSDRLGSQQPILDYAHGYALNNWQFVDDKNPEKSTYSNDMIAPNRELPLSNIKLIREINGCKDEAGFILNHVVIGVPPVALGYFVLSMIYFFTIPQCICLNLNV